MSAVKETAESVRPYASYLVKCKNSMTLLRSDSSPNKDRIDTHFVMPNPIEPVRHVDIRYRALHGALEEKADFQFIILDSDFGHFVTPEDRKARFRWFEELALGCRCKLFYIIKIIITLHYYCYYYYRANTQ